VNKSSTFVIKMSMRFAHLQVYWLVLLYLVTLHIPLESMWSFFSVSLLLSIPFTSLFVLVSYFILLAFPLHSIVILFIIPSTLFLPLHLHIYSSVLFTVAAWFLSSLTLIPSRPPANFPTAPFPTSSFLSVSPLIYLSCWAPTWSDALPLCLCCMCVICIPYLP